MIPVIIAGVEGKMGKEILRLALDDPGINVAGVFEHPDHPGIGKEAAPGLPIGDRLEDLLPSGEVLIDFTTPSASLEHLRIVSEHGKRIVMGTTGFSSEQAAEIREKGRKIPMVWAPNMSVGINLMFKVVQEMCRILGPEYDVEILEIHHRLKKDAPSGTALRLAERVAEARQTPLERSAVYARHGIIGPRKEGEIGIQTLRAGDVVGEHTVLFAAPGERLELTHRCHSRANFARGALQAAHWIADQPPGLYDMQDVLGLR